jgi:hypothetical protein
MGIAELPHGEPDLAEVAGALCPSGGGPRRLHGWEQQPDQHGNDRNHDEQFHEREGGRVTTFEIQ